MKKTAPFQILLEDDHIIAVNKASGIAVCADRWDDSRERLDRLLVDFLKLEKIFIVHRIDRDTSGLVIFAKDAVTHKKLSAAFETKRIKKKYIAAVRGRPVWKETVCDLPLVPDGNKKHLTIIDKYMGKKSVTRLRLLGSAGNYSVVEAFPETGRTHQIRVHLSGLGHSIVCDELYGNKKPVYLSAIKSGWRGDPAQELPLISRLGLHAAELFIPGFAAHGNVGTGNAGSAHAANGDDGADKHAAGLLLRAPLPRDMAALLKQMEKCSGSFVNQTTADSE